MKVARIPVDGSGLVPDVCLIEVGGTVGDIESMVFLEAIRQFQRRVPRHCFCLVHVSLVPVMGTVGEQKTKPTQHGVKELRTVGLSPNLIVCRASEPLKDATRDKISRFCNVPAENVVSVHNVSNIFYVPLILQEQNVHLILADLLQLECKSPELTSWRQLASSYDTTDDMITVAIIGKYTDLHDAYLSVNKAIRHACMASKCGLNLSWIESSDLEPKMETEDKAKFDLAWGLLHACDAIVVPGGFGERGVDGKVLAAKYAREERKPYLGICLGMQVMVIEYARTVLGWANANSSEVDENCEHKVVVKMLEHHKGGMGGTMRLGSRATHMDDRSSTVRLLYGNAAVINERHRHRYEVNPELEADFEKAGLMFTGKDETGERMSVTELPRSVHPYYVGTQAHPELKSRPGNPSPFFHGLILAARGKLGAEIGMDDTVKLPMRKRTISTASTSSAVGGPPDSPRSFAPGVGELKKQKVIHN